MKRVGIDGIPERNVLRLITNMKRKMIKMKKLDKNDIIESFFDSDAIKKFVKRYRDTDKSVDSIYDFTYKYISNVKVTKNKMCCNIIITLVYEFNRMDFHIDFLRTICDFFVEYQGLFVRMNIVPNFIVKYEPIGTVHLHLN